MKHQAHKAIAFLLLPAAGAAAQGRGHYQNFCTSGATKASVQGLQSINFLQSITPNCTVKVYLTGTVTPATIYQDANDTPLGNPFTGTISGYYSFYVSGAFDVVMSGAGMTTTTLSNINLDRTTGTLTGFSATGSGGITTNVTGTTAPALAIGVDVLHVIPLLTDTQYWNGLVASVSGQTGNGFVVTSTGGNAPAIGVKTDGTHAIPLNSDVANWNAKISRAGDPNITGQMGCTFSGPCWVQTGVNPGYYFQALGPLVFDIDRIVVGAAQVENDYVLPGGATRQFNGSFLLNTIAGDYRIEDRYNLDQHHGVTFESGYAHLEGGLTVLSPAEVNGGTITSSSPCSVWDWHGQGRAQDKKGGIFADDTYLYHCNSNGIGYTRIAWTAIP